MGISFLKNFIWPSQFCGYDRYDFNWFAFFRGPYSIAWFIIKTRQKKKNYYPAARDVQEVIK